MIISFSALLLLLLLLFSPIAAVRFGDEEDIVEEMEVGVGAWMDCGDVGLALGVFGSFSSDCVGGVKRSCSIRRPSRGTEVGDCGV